MTTHLQKHQSCHPNPPKSFKFPQAGEALLLGSPKYAATSGGMGQPKLEYSNNISISWLVARMSA